MITGAAVFLCFVAYCLHGLLADRIADNRTATVDDEGEGIETVATPGSLKAALLEELDYLECSRACPGCHQVDRSRKRLLFYKLEELRARCDDAGRDLDATCDSEVVTLTTPLPRLRVVSDDHLQVLEDEAGWACEEHPSPAMNLSMTYIDLRSRAPQKKAREVNARIS
ncbi:MAG: hypothetical protein AAF627_10375 [Myxococcota bacterium]